MKLVIQRVQNSSVSIDGKVHGKIGRGFLILVGFCPADTPEILPKLVDKLIHLRVFEDDEGKMNLSLLDVGGSILSVSQFTLYADCRKGRRPSFTGAARPEIAEPLYKQFNEALRAQGVTVETGVFGADMQVSLVNDGPVTILLDSADL